MADATPTAIEVLEDLVIHYSMGWELGRLMEQAAPLVAAYQKARAEQVAPTALPASVCFTGSMEQMTRDEHKVKAEAAGYRVVNSVSKLTTFVVAGPGAGSKLTTAREIGVHVVEEDWWIDLLRLEAEARSLRPAPPPPPPPPTKGIV